MQQMILCTNSSFMLKKSNNTIDGEQYASLHFALRSAGVLPYSMRPLPRAGTCNDADNIMLLLYNFYKINKLILLLVVANYAWSTPYIWIHTFI